MLYPLWKKSGNFLQKNKLYPPYDSGIPLKDTNPREMKAFIHKDLHKSGHSCFIYKTGNWELHQ